jgi:hypothetical protein
VVAHVSKAGAAPRLRFKDAHVHNSDGSVLGDKLDEYKGWCFWWGCRRTACCALSGGLRFGLTLPLPWTVWTVYWTHVVVVVVAMNIASC